MNKPNINEQEIGDFIKKRMLLYLRNLVIFEYVSSREEVWCIVNSMLLCPEITGIVRFENKKFKEFNHRHLGFMFSINRI